MEPLISIVLPTYNGARYLKESIESCLSQTHKNIELILVNDCSTDESPSILEKYAAQDPRVLILNNESNCKLPASLNRGFSIAKGRFFTWTSDDNRFAPDAISTMLAELRDDTKADIVYSSYYFMNSDGAALDKFGGPPEEILFKCVVGACFLYKREVHESLKGYDTRKFRMEDFDFWLRAATKFKFRYIDIPHLYYYRKHTESLSTEIASNETVYQEYRNYHLLSFDAFFRKIPGLTLTKEQLEDHVQLYFEDIVKNKNWNFSVADQTTKYLHHLEMLKSGDWATIGFDSGEVARILDEKRDRIVSLIINDLIFDNKILRKENPQLAKNLGKPISWYYKEYEVLPLWYKRLGHILKMIQGNKPITSRMKNKETP